MAKKKIPLLYDGIWMKSGCYVKAWKENRNFVVQVWLKESPDGEPDGDWEMPGILGLTTAANQAVLQTKTDKQNDRVV